MQFTILDSVDGEKERIVAGYKDNKALNQIFTKLINLTFHTLSHFPDYIADEIQKWRDEIEDNRKLDILCSFYETGIRVYSMNDTVTFEYSGEGNPFTNANYIWRLTSVTELLPDSDDVMRKTTVLREVTAKPIKRAVWVVRNEENDEAVSRNEKLEDSLKQLIFCCKQCEDDEKMEKYSISREMEGEEADDDCIVEGGEKKDGPKTIPYIKIWNIKRVSRRHEVVTFMLPAKTDFAKFNRVAARLCKDVNGILQYEGDIGTVQKQVYNVLAKQFGGSWKITSIIA